MNISDYYEIEGDGPPIVFIHGSFATTSAWKGIVKELSTNHTCILLKLPGHGGAADPDDFSDPAIETELEILASVVKSLTAEPVHLVGHSFGGVVALAQALKGNLQLSQLSLFEPVAIWLLNRVKNFAARATVDEFLFDYRQAVLQKQPSACGKVIDFWGGKGHFELLPEKVKQSMEVLVANNIRHWNTEAAINSTLAELESCSIPTRLVCGTESNSVAISICGHLNEALPNSRKYVIPGASHFLVTSHAHQCVEVLQD